MDCYIEELASKKVIPLRHPGRWIAGVAALVVLAPLVHALVTNPVFQWDVFGYWFVRPVILQGLVVTLELTGLSAIFGLLGGIVLALMRLSKNRFLRAVAWGYVWIFRSIPLIVVLLFLSWRRLPRSDCRRPGSTGASSCRRPRGRSSPPTPTS